MTLSKQLFANNAKTTVASSIGPSDTTIQVTDGSIFPNPNSSAGEFFLATLEAGGNIEIIKVLGRTGNSFTGCVRAQEGTIASSFGAGSRIDNRLTRDTMAAFARKIDKLDEVSTLDSLDTPAKSNSNSYLTHINDDSGNPIIAFKNTSSNWRFSTHSIIQVSGAISSGTTTSAVSTAIGSSNVVSVSGGKYIIQFTTGLNAGLARLIISASTNTVSWLTVLPNVPANGDQFEIYKSNVSSISDLISNSGEAYGIATGTGDAAVATTVPNIGFSLFDGLEVKIRWPGTNTVTNPTLNINSTGVKTVTSAEGGIINIGMLSSSTELTARYNISLDKYLLVNIVDAYAPIANPVFTTPVVINTASGVETITYKLANVEQALHGVSQSSNGLTTGTAAGDFASRVASSKKFFWSCDAGTTAHMSLSGSLLSLTTSISAGSTTGPNSISINGIGSGTAGGSYLSAQAAGTSIVSIGNKSAIAGGAYDATPYLYSNATLFTNQSLSVGGGVSLQSTGAALVVSASVGINTTYMQVANAGGLLQIGVDNSAGGGIVTGSSPYDACITSGTGKNLVVGVGAGATKVATFSSTGLDIASGLAITIGGAALASIPAGTIISYSGTSAPTGFLACPTAVTNISRTTYAALFAAINTTWGSGNGTTTFGMPYVDDAFTLLSRAGSVGSGTSGVLLAHTHDVPGGYPNGSGGSAGIGTAGGVSGQTTNNQSPAGSSVNIAAGRFVLFCVKY